MTLKVAVINDYSVVIAGVRSLLAPYSDRVQVVETSTGGSSMKAVDVALYDTFAAPPDWRVRLSSLSQDARIGSVVVYSFIDDVRAVKDSFATGAGGYLSKSLSALELVDAIERVAAGDRVTLFGVEHTAVAAESWAGEAWGLTPREAEMIALIAQGRSNEEIATACYLSMNTVKSYIRAAYRKIGVSTRSQAVAWGMTHGLRHSV